MDFHFTASLTRWQSDKTTWHFITLTPDVADGVRFFHQTVAEQQQRRGFGAIKVQVQIGETAWSTSIFPDKASQSFLLPVKKQVREAEDLIVGTEVAVRLSLDGL